jgi:N6-L-threonylcarbamoyladenine synthase
VVPELASREHVRFVLPIVDEAMRGSGTSPADLAAIAVTQGPGLIGCLAVGLSTAKALALAWEKPLVGVNHLEGHFFSAELETDPIDYPAVVLLVSGGHTMLVHAPSRGVYRVLGQTRDDSVGEAYDKVARELGLGYPGGPVVDRLAKEGRPVHPLPRPMLREGLDFSFSGLKTAVRRLLAEKPYEVPDVAASFAAACTDVLAGKLARAIEEHQPRSAVVVGGVAASPVIRARLQVDIPPLGVRLVLPPLKYATDNAAMIGAAGWWRLENGGPADAGIGPRPDLRLPESATAG